MARLKFENRGALAGGLRPLPCLYIKPTTNKEDFKAVPTLSCHLPADRNQSLIFAVATHSGLFTSLCPSSVTFLIAKVSQIS